jgi:phosphoesterase RecJ-like protein
MAMATVAENMTGNGMAEIRGVAQALRAAKRVTAICHENPDADTIGAAIAVRLIAERLGAEAEVVSADRIPPVFAFLPAIDEVRPRPTLRPDLAVVCDAATLERVGRIARDEADWFSRAKLLNIDHHISNKGFGDLNLVDPQAAATCEVLLRLVDELDLELDVELATALLTGIVRDSHGFSDRSTSGDTLRAAARLVDAGASLALIHRYVLSELPYPTMTLWGKMLAGMGQAADGRIVHTTLTQAMLDETGTQQHDADGIAEFLARAKGADVTLLLRELGPSQTRVSIRTTDAVDATRIAACFGGGGHSRRAGCSVPLATAPTLDEVLRAIQLD